MRVRCVSNKAKDLKIYEYKSLRNEELGRFGAFENSEYNGIAVGKEYWVMGMILFDSFLGYLVDDFGFIGVYPCQLFEIMDNRLSSNWHFRALDKDEENYPFVQAIWGYHELCYYKNEYQNLIVDMSEDAVQIYFKRKEEMETIK